MKHDPVLKMTDEIAKKFKDFFATNDFQTAMKSLKDVSTEYGTFRMIISTDNVDRHGEIVSQDGWMTENYMQNPVVLWGHESYSIPIGITDKLITETEGSVKRTVAEGRFASHEFAQTIRKLYDDGMMKTASVGFIPLEYEGNKITKAELLEWSFVSIPANPFAIDARGYDVEMLKAKGIIADMKTGDEIETTTEEEEEEEEEPTEEQLSEIEEDEDNVVLTFANGEKKTFKRAPTFKSGRVLSKANKELILNAKVALEAVLAIADDTEENAIVVAPEGEKAKEIQEAEDFLKLRKGMQGIATMLSEVLADAKTSAEKRGIKVR